MAAMPAVTDRIEVVEGDITQLNVDAIVNAANSSLLGGGGVDGAIHRAAGPRLYDECRALGGCRTGDARITQGYDLPARFVIHTVGPVWAGGGQGEDDHLESCYQRSLQLAVENGVRSIAFPAIGTGVYRFPLERATDIAVRTVAAFLKADPSIERVIFATFGSTAYEAYEEAVQQLAGS
jgi:O-acetyl-ADP-ribose deacetylase (regulator of RNase III)